MDLSRIKDEKLIKRIYDIAKNDGGENAKEIDNPKGIEELGKLLGGGFGRKLTKDEQDVILGLCIDFQSKNSKQSSPKKNSNSVGSNNNFHGANGTNVTNTGNQGVAVGHVTGSNTMVGNNNIQINIIDSVVPKFEINPKDKIKGQTLAKKMFNETVDSTYAFNDDIVDYALSVDSKNAYSFFMEYKNLRDGKSNLIQDIYKVSDTWDRITLSQASHMINALLHQAKNIGLQKNDAYKNLESYSKNIANKRNKDPTKEERIELDYAIQTLLDEIAKVYGDKK